MCACVRGEFSLVSVCGVRMRACVGVLMHLIKIIKILIIQQ